VRELKGLRDRLSTWTQASPAAGPASKAALRWIPMAAGAALLLVLGALAGRRTAPPSLPPPRLTYITSSGQDGVPAISPDGRLCAFASSRDGVSRIWLKQLVDGSEIALTEGPDRAPRFTPDSTGVFFIRGVVLPSGVVPPGALQPAVYRVSALGGAPRKVVGDATEVDVSADGSRIAFLRTRIQESVRTQELWVAGNDGSSAHLVDSGDAFNFRSPRWSPDGAWIATTRARSTSAPGG